MGQRIVDFEVQEGVVWCEMEGMGYLLSRFKYMLFFLFYGRMFVFDVEG